MDTDRNHTVIVYEILNLPSLPKIRCISPCQMCVIQVYLLICRTAQRNRRPIFHVAVFPVDQNRCKIQKPCFFWVSPKRMRLITGINQNIPWKVGDAFQARPKRFGLVEWLAARDGETIRVFFTDERFQKPYRLTDGHPLRRPSIP